MKKDDLVKEMLDLVKDQTIQNNKIMEQMLIAQTAQAHVLQSWIEMFKPAATPIKSTSPEQRSTLKSLDEDTGWEPLNAHELTALFTSELN